MLAKIEQLEIAIGQHNSENLANKAQLEQERSKFRTIEEENRKLKSDTNNVRNLESQLEQERSKFRTIEEENRKLKSDISKSNPLKDDLLNQI